MRCLAIFVFAVPALAGAQQLLDFRNDLAFRQKTVEAFAEHVYRARLRKLNAEDKLDRDQALLARIRGIIDRLRPAIAYEKPSAATISWEVHVCRECNENASSMAGGRLLLAEEFIASIAPSYDELGYLIAHEMAHVIAEHTREFATSARFFVGNGLERNYEDIQHELSESIAVNLRMAPDYAQQELEADYIGFILGARSRLKPGAMLSLLAKLKLGAGQSSFLAFHPPDAERIQQARTMLESAQRLYARSLSSAASGK